MRIDGALRAALGYMVPEGEEIEEMVATLYDSMQAEMAACDDMHLAMHQRERPLRKGCGDLITHTIRIGSWQEWTISRRDLHGDVWEILTWEAIDESAD